MGRAAGDRVRGRGSWALGLAIAACSGEGGTAGSGSTGVAAGSDAMTSAGPSSADGSSSAAGPASDSSSGGSGESTTTGSAAPYALSGLDAMPPQWEAPRLFDGAFSPDFTQGPGSWARTGVAIVPPGSRILIGPRHMGTDATVDPPLSGTILRVANEDIDLDAYPRPDPEHYDFGTVTESYFGRGSGQVHSYGIALDLFEEGEYTVQGTSLVELGGEAIPWTDDFDVVVRPYIRDVFAGRPPAPRDPWVVPSDATVIVGGTVITATGAPPMTNGVVAIQGEWITAVGVQSDFDLSSGPTIYDATGRFVIPGLLNAHAHFSGDAGNPPEDWLADGVTTIVDVGARVLVACSVREGFATAGSPHPDLVVAGAIIEAPGAQHQRDFGTPGFFAIEGPEDATDATLRLADWGVNLIKVSVGDLGAGFDLDAEEVAAVVDAAHSRGLVVMAHTVTTEQVDTALAAGVDTLTHLPALTDAQIQTMATAGVRLVPTLSASYRPLAELLDDAQRAHAAGVPLGTGNDFPAHPRGLPQAEIDRLEQAGLSRMEVIEATTRVAAEAVGIGNVVGTLEAGKIADVVVLDADPLVSLDNLDSVARVYKRGEPFDPG